MAIIQILIILDFVILISAVPVWNVVCCMSCLCTGFEIQFGCALLSRLQQNYNAKLKFELKL